MEKQNNDKIGRRRILPLDVHLGVTPDQLEKAGVLNVVLGIDTQLFIDPKLLDTADIPEFANARKLVNDYFIRLIKVHAQAGLSKRVQDIAINMIAVKEPKGLAIGYGNSRDSGTAISIPVAHASLRSLTEMIAVGINDIEVMEMLGLFIKDFGCDSISDLIAHIIYEDLCCFTERVCKELKIKTKKYDLPSGLCYDLPPHPFRNHQIIFVPLELVSPLPLATSWQDIKEVAGKNAQARRDLNAIIGTNVATFVTKIKNNPDILIKSADDMRTVLDIYKAAQVRKYSTKEDPSGFVRLADFASQLARSNKEPIDHKVKTIDEMIGFISTAIVGKFKHHIEQLGANSLLYQKKGKLGRTVDTTKPLHEEAAQILFFLVADDACKLDEVIGVRESTTGAGAIDFLFGNIPDNKVLVEIKKSNNSNLLDGYTNQIERYMEAERAVDAFYVVVIVDEKSVSYHDSQLNQLQERHKKRTEDGERTPHLVVIDGRIGKTASKLKDKDRK